MYSQAKSVFHPLVNYNLIYINDAVFLQVFPLQICLSQYEGVTQHIGIEQVLTARYEVGSPIGRAVKSAVS